MEPVFPNPMSRALRILIALYISVLHMGLVAALLLFWPIATPTLAVALELRFLILAAVSGALGSTLHLASSFIEHAAQGRLHSRWALWYLLRPLIGLSLAVLVYLLLRGGLIAGASASATESLNPYGITALAALAGLFSRQAMRKLKETFEHLCTTKEDAPADSAR